jgi:hypothetical protein
MADLDVPSLPPSPAHRYSNPGRPDSWFGRFGPRPRSVLSPYRLANRVGPRPPRKTMAQADRSSREIRRAPTDAEGVPSSGGRIIGHSLACFGRSRDWRARSHSKHDDRSSIHDRSWLLARTEVCGPAGCLLGDAGRRWCFDTIPALVASSRPGHTGTRRMSAAPSTARLPERPDPAILEIVRALARLAAREDHQRDEMERKHEARSDLRPVFD